MDLGILKRSAMTALLLKEPAEQKLAKDLLLGCARRSGHDLFHDS